MRQILLNKSVQHGIVLITACIIVIFFYHKTFFHANETYFTITGDGIQHYLGSIYHPKYDTSLFRTQYMNYPYGEMVFFTGNQAFFAGTLQLISKYIFNISDYTIGIINLLMLLSIVFAAFFIYLILVKLNVHWIVSGFAGIAIAFLSPQLDRFGGHQTLSHVCFIPCMLYLLFLFDRKWSYGKSILILILVYISAATHMYYLGFMSLLTLFYWGYQFISKNRTQKELKTILFHSTIQFLLPILLIKLSILLNTDVTDRPTKPWGFLLFRAHPASIFIPYNQPYGHFLKKYGDFQRIPWEGVAFVGIVPTIIFLILCVNLLRKLIKKQFIKAIQVTDNTFLNIMFWASMAGLLYSFGVPFIFKMEWLSDYLGPLRQMRGIARFSWLFFYIFNIITLYIIWKYFKSKTNKKVGLIILIITSLLYGFDGYENVWTKPKVYYHKLPVLSDWENTHPDNTWLDKIEIDSFQAILPIPYYHLGSENYWVDSKCNLLTSSCIISAKSGLPIMATFLSRGSVSQGLNGILTVKEPYRPLQILNDLPNNKDLLIVAGKCDEKSQWENNILVNAKILDTLSFIYLYRISPDVLKNFAKTRTIEQNQFVHETSWNKINNTLTTDTCKSWIIRNYDKTGKATSYKGDNAFSITEGKKQYLFFMDTLPHLKPELLYTISFWFRNINQDLYPRTRLKIYIEDSNGNFNVKQEIAIEKIIQLVDKEWALIETEIGDIRKGTKLRMELANNLLKRKDSIILDELMIRPGNVDILEKEAHGFWLNNRYYSRTKINSL